MFYQSDADLCAAALKEREAAWRQARFDEGRDDGTADHLTGAWMRWVCFDHNRTTCGEGAKGIRSSYGDGEREIARAEHNNWTDGQHDATNVGLWQRLAFWNGVIDAGLRPGMISD
jgi:hypothetical protein